MQDEQDYVPRPAVPPPQGGGELPYQPRIRKNRAPPPPPPPGSAQQQDPFQYQNQYQERAGENPPGMLALEDRLEKYAEGS